MQTVIRLSPTVTLRLTPRLGSIPTSISSSKLRIKIKPKGQALAGITNVIDNQPIAASTTTVVDGMTPEVDSTEEEIKNESSLLSSPPLSIPMLTPSMSTPGPFYHIAYIGKGAFGEAIAVCDMRGLQGSLGRLLCLKVFEKEEVRRNRMECVVVQELMAYQKLALAARGQVGGWLPFVMRLEASMEDPYRVFFAMELMNCDMFCVLSKWDFDTVRAHRKLWIAQIATGLAALHSSGIIHRDIKPENVLIDFSYNVRITDFGCAYISPGGGLHRYGEYCSEITGTWPYQAPEMLVNRGKPKANRRRYTIAIDYWGLGCLAYELESFTGGWPEREECEPLFQTETELNVYLNYQSVLNRGRCYPKFESLSERASSLVSGLLRPSAQLRYGDCDLRRHEYFNEDTGHNVFREIDARRKAGLKNISYKNSFTAKNIGDNTRSTIIYSPLPYTPKGKPSLLSFKNHGWINPQGIWGSTQSNPACYASSR